MTPNKFTWSDKAVIEFSKLCSQGQYGIFQGAKTIKQKLKVFKMSKSRLLSQNTASVTLSDVMKSGNMSPHFHINKLKAKSPYKLVKNRYEPTDNFDKAIWLTNFQVKQINNLLFGIDKIKEEIERIKNSDEVDELVVDSKLSSRAKNVVYNLFIRTELKENEIMLSDVANIKYSDLVKGRGMGARTLKEIISYLKKHGFILK